MRENDCQCKTICKMCKLKKTIKKNCACAYCSNCVKYLIHLELRKSVFGKLFSHL